ncbi:MAG: glycosyltransferase, partial [Mesorhizobium sp.]
RIAATEAQRDEIATDAAHWISAAEARCDEMAADAARRIAATEAQRDEIAADAAQRISVAEAQRDEMAADAAQRIAAAEARRVEIAQEAAARQEEFAEVSFVADQRLQEIGTLKNELAHMRAHIELTDRTYSERKPVTILKPIYWRLYRRGGRILRAILPAPALERLKRRLPVPGGIPRALAFAPLPSATIASDGYAAIPARRGEKPDIFVLSIISWDFRVQRPQHLALQMAAEGHRVFYIDMEREMGAGSAREVAPNLHVIRLPAQGMRSLAAYTGIPSPAQVSAWVRHFHALADAVSASPVAHVVLEHPYWWHLARHLSPEYQITFDCMDDISGFSNTESHVLETEMDMIGKADKMAVSSQYLYDKFGAIRDVVMVRNGTDVSHFVDCPEDIPAPAWLGERKAKGTIRVGYVGAIAEWFDTDLIEQVACENPDFEIHLCGAVTAEQPMRLASIANVTMHGEIPYRDVPAFHKQMDVLIIPFQLLPIIKACDPVKFYEYSAVMRPTVSTSLPELDRAGDLVFRSDHPAGFATQIRRAAPLAQDSGFGHRLRQYALDNAWSFRAHDMLKEMQREPKLSVIVLHYGTDTDMTVAALHAMLGRGQVYPNLEVVLVDNGSSAEVLDVLRAYTAADPRIVLIENGENLGFAKGNNRGIEAATGEFILLLNNDTFIAPGAMLAMVRHLQRNPEIGIVGPMTNNIGNEARVEIGYADMEAMVRAARDLATGYRGQWNPVAVCAYFCAMFRRADLDRLGLLPEIYGRGMFEDDDHCATFRAAGLQMALAEDAFCHHHLSATFDKLPRDEKQTLFANNRAIFEERWGRWVPHVYRDNRPPATLSKA